MYDVKKAFEGSTLSADEQYNFLDELEKNIIKMKKDLDKDCVYCEQCQKRFFKKDCPVLSHKVEKIVCLNPLEGGYLEPYEYDLKEVEEFYRMCPEGHKIGGYVEWL